MVILNRLNILGGISFILTLIALYVLGGENKIGWIIFLPSYAVQIYIFCKTKQWFLIGQMCVLFVFSLVNFFR